MKIQNFLSLLLVPIFIFSSVMPPAYALEGIDLQTESIPEKPADENAEEQKVENSAAVQEEVPAEFNLEGTTLTRSAPAAVESVDETAATASVSGEVLVPAAENLTVNTLNETEISGLTMTVENSTNLSSYADELTGLDINFDFETLWNDFLTDMDTGTDTSLTTDSSLVFTGTTLSVASSAENISLDISNSLILGSTDLTVIPSLDPDIQSEESELFVRAAPPAKKTPEEILKEKIKLKIKELKDKIQKIIFDDVPLKKQGINQQAANPQGKIFNLNNLPNIVVTQAVAGQGQNQGVPASRAIPEIKPENLTILGKAIFVLKSALEKAEEALANTNDLNGLKAIEASLANIEQGIKIAPNMTLIPIDGQELANLTVSNLPQIDILGGGVDAEALKKILEDVKKQAGANRKVVGVRFIFSMTPGKKMSDFPGMIGKADQANLEARPKVIQIVLVDEKGRPTILQYSLRLGVKDVIILRPEVIMSANKEFLEAFGITITPAPAPAPAANDVSADVDLTV